VSDMVDALNDTLWVSLAEAGRSQNPPVSRAAVIKRVKKLLEAGRLVTRKGPMGSTLVHLPSYLRAVNDETDPAQDLRNGRSEAPVIEDPEDDKPTASLTGDANYHKSRARREAINAETARLDLDERLGLLVLRADVDLRTTEIFRKFRDRLLGMPPTLSDVLAAKPDAAAIRTELDDQLRLMLEALAKSLDAMGEAEEEDD
jgi:biotin operon repressor